MGAYSFKARFVPMVEDGRKRHTIRAARRNPDKPGSTAHLFYAMRTKQCRKLFAAPIVKVEQIAIKATLDALYIAIDGNALTRDERAALAVCDGFASEEDMQLWWLKVHGLEVFHGHVIHWDYDRRGEVSHA